MDLIVIAGAIDDIKSKIKDIEKLVMEEPNAENIDWAKVQLKVEHLIDSADTLYYTVDDGLNG